VSEIGEYEEDAHITFAILDAVNGNIEDAMTTFESIKNVVSYWNLALVSSCGICIKSVLF
jgi:E3 SUMO-protein ligase RanBP2